MPGRSAAALWLGAPVQQATAPDAVELALVWGDTLLEAGRIGEGEVSIGDAPGCTVATPLGGRYVLATVRNGSVEILPLPGMQVERWIGGSPQRCASAFVLCPNELAVVRFGALEIVFRLAPPVERPEGGTLARDFAWARAISFSAMGAAFLLAVVGTAPREEGAPGEPMFSQRERSVFHLVPKQPRQPVEPSRLVVKTPPAPGDVDRFRKPRPDRADGRDRRQPGAKRAADRELVENTGLLKALQGIGGAGEDLLAGTNLGSAVNEALGGLQGRGSSGAGGLGGLSTRGSGPGVGGTSLSLGGIGTGRHGKRSGGGSIGRGGSSKAKTRIVPGETRVVGGLSKEVIGGYITGRWNEIRSCYERELQKDPELQGKVAVIFTISGSGRVAGVDAAEDTVGDGAVARCIVGKIQGWRFPAPKGGGEVVVSYPWIFRAAGR